MAELSSEVLRVVDDVPIAKVSCHRPSVGRAVYGPLLAPKVLIVPPSEKRQPLGITTSGVGPPATRRPAVPIKKVLFVVSANVLRLLEIVNVCV